MAQVVGATACEPCHAEQYAKHRTSTHARSLSPGDAPHQWKFGAGKQAVTPVSRAGDEHYLEHGLSWYPAIGKFDLTPGHENTLGERYRIFDPGAAILRCFQCHSTGPLAVTPDGAITIAQAGVQCEACHGPGQRHVTDRAPMRNPGKLTAAAMNDACGACHRKPAAAGSDTDFANPWNARHQPLYLARSACFLKSGGRLSCLTCHDAHSGEARPACANCHADVKHRQAVAGSCESCHMPAVRPRPGLAFANHWIAIYGEDPLRPRAR